MLAYQILGGIPLEGTIAVSGAKNSSLILLAASLLASGGISSFQNVPDILDIHVMISLLSNLGALASYDPETEVATVRASGLSSSTPSEHDVRLIRASITLLGPLLARCGYARMPYPGGDAIGARSIELHLRGFEALGAVCKTEYGMIEISAPHGLKGASYYFDFPTVNGTQNLMMAAVLAKGTTTIQNPAREPEIVDLANYLTEMGAKIRGAGTTTIVIEGVSSLKGASHAVIPDRLEAGTYLIAGAMTGGRLFVQGALSEHLHAPLSKMREMGISIEESEDGIGAHATGAPLRATSFHTQVFPGVPTDLQAPLMALLTQAHGKGIVTETIFENRFQHVPELVRLGAQIRVNGSSAYITGGHALTGSTVKATDIRSGAALVCAGLAAQGVTTIQECYHIERGYVRMIQKLRSLGAQIRLLEEEPSPLSHQLGG